MAAQALQAKVEKLVQGFKQTAPKLLKDRELENLVKAIGECKSKAEEDRIITQELEVLKQRLSDPKLDKSRGREYMVRLIYCEMLGHDASFAYIKALQFASDPNIHTKKVCGLHVHVRQAPFVCSGLLHEPRCALLAGGLSGAHAVPGLQQPARTSPCEHAVVRHEVRQLLDRSAPAQRLQLCLH
jgi:hypothetical protein